jgi:hypothetical protein
MNTIIKLCRLGVVAMAAAVGVSAASAAEVQRWIQIQNNSSVALDSILVQHSDSSEWSADLLEGRDVQPGESLAIQISVDDAGCVYDVEINHVDDIRIPIPGDEPVVLPGWWLLSDVDLCEVKTIITDGVFSSAVGG